MAAVGNLHRPLLAWLIGVLSFLFLASLFIPYSGGTASTTTGVGSLNGGDRNTMVNLDKALQQSIKNQTNVSLRIMKQLLMFEEKAKDKNVVFSPLSIQAVLGLLASGASGATREQLVSFLGSKSMDQINKLYTYLASHVFHDGNPNGGPRLNFANSVWFEKSLSVKPGFKWVVDYVHNASLHYADFISKPSEVVRDINSWTEKETKGLIDEIVSENDIDDSTRFILANSLYFKGDWEDKFDKSRTKEYDFHHLNGKSSKSPFMESNEDQLIGVYDGFKVLRMPYKRGEDKRNFSMYFFLPDSNGGLVRLTERLTTEVGFIERHIPQSQVQVGDFRIPKFKITFDFDAPNMLQKLGLVLPFLPTEGGFNEMVDPPPLPGQELYVSKVIHKSVIEVNEGGTEAAAVTAVIGLAGCAQPLEFPEKIDFVADRPFLFIIREDTTGAVLFVGRVLDPKQQ